MNIAHEKPPAISVVMPAYNAERYVAEAIQSILDQTFGDFEFIILNDGSTDHTAKVIRGFTDRRIVFIDEANNGGLVKRLNQGFAVAKGIFIARMDADDWSFPQRFEKQVAYMEANPDICVLGTSHMWVNHDMKTINNVDILNRKLTTMPIGHVINHASVMIRRSLWPEWARYSKDYPHVEDYKLWLDLLPFVRIENLSELLIKYRRHWHSMSEINTEVQQKNEARVQVWFLEQHLQTTIPTQHQEAWRWLAWNDTTIRLAQLSALCSFLEGKILAVGPVGADKIELNPQILRPLIKQHIRNHGYSLKHHIFDKVDVTHLRWHYKYKIKNKLQHGISILNIIRK